MSRVYSGTQLTVKSGAGFWGELVLDRFDRLLAIIFLLQLLQCFKEYWWTETFSVMYGVLAVTAVCELAFTRWQGLRLALETAAAFLLSAAYSPFYQWIGWPGNWKSREQWSLFYDAHIVSLHPFIELAVGAVLTVHVLSWIGRNRNAMLAVMVTSIGVMATFDSFFPLDLWHNIAWIVSAGLAWLVILHLRQLRARHPHSWDALAERPVELALPAVLVIGLLMLSGVVMPRAPALLEDPYTIWSQAQGIDVASLAGEGGVLNSSTLIGGSGSSSSGYGRDDRNIGGGFDFDFSPVMTVQSSRRSYWRGETKAVYTGKGWADRRTELTLAAPGGETNFSIPGRAEGAKTEKITQTVTFLRKDKIPVLFGAGPVSRVTELKSDNNAGLQLSQEEWELRFRKPAKVQSYTVESEVTMLDRAKLRGVKVPKPEAGSIDLKPYLQLPQNLPSRVKDLAAQITAEGKNEFDKADLLERYLKTTFPYNNKPDIAKQTSADVTDAFLFEIKEGYCDYYSTAFVVMARSLGIPARWVKGYNSGIDPALIETLRFGGTLVDPDGPGSYTVRNADAHSWAEVYFEGFGWIPFEPTAGFSVPQPVPSDALPESTADPAALQTPDATGTQTAVSNWWMPLTGAVLLAFSAAVLMRKRRGALLWQRIRYAGASPNQRIVREMDRLLRHMKRKGMKREPHETMRETFRRWGDKFSSLRPDFDGILVRFERARYGKDTGNDTEVSDFEAAVYRLRKAL